MPTDQKDKNYWSVLDAVIRLEVSRGHLAWKITDVSRMSGVTRPLIYYYFGKSKEEILQNALKLIGDEFFGLSKERLEMWAKGEVAESVKRTRQLLVLAPYVSEFYFHWRHQPGETADQLKDIEKRYRDKIARLYPHRSKTDIEAVFAIFFGLILYPDLGEKALMAVVDRIRDFLSTQ